MNTDQKLYKIKLSQDELTFIWLLSTAATGKGPYKEFFDDINTKLRNHVNPNVDITNPREYIKGEIRFNGRRLSVDE